jgi:hypothetical protein
LKGERCCGGGRRSAWGAILRNPLEKGKGVSRSPYYALRSPGLPCASKGAILRSALFLGGRSKTIRSSSEAPSEGWRRGRDHYVNYNSSLPQNWLQQSIAIPRLWLLG